MKNSYFIVVLAHSMHGRLRRIQIPHKVVYAVAGLALIGVITVMGFVASYARMAWKVADYNALRAEFNTLRTRYQKLQHETTQKSQQLASLQLFATEVSVAYGLKDVDGGSHVSADASLVPSYKESLEEYNFLESANFSVFSRKFPRLWQKHTRPTLWPINGRLGSYFGKRLDPLTGVGTFHTGVDIPTPVGTPVRAAGDGIVTRAEWAGNYGRLVAVNHGGGIETLYGHLSRIDVIAGQEIRRGQIIGLSGRSGRVSGPHLHYEVRQGGNPVNPYIFLKKSDRPAKYAKRDLPF